MTDVQQPQIQTVTTSKQFAMNLKDWIQTAEFGAVGSIIGILDNAIDAFANTKVLHLDYKTILTFAGVGALTALVNKWKAKQQTIVVNPQDIPKVNAAAAGLPIIQSQNDTEAKPDKAS